MSSKVNTLNLEYSFKSTLNLISFEVYVPSNERHSFCKRVKSRAISSKTIVFSSSRQETILGANLLLISSLTLVALFLFKITPHSIIRMAKQKRCRPDLKLTLVDKKFIIRKMGFSLLLASTSLMSDMRLNKIANSLAARIRHFIWIVSRVDLSSNLTWLEPMYSFTSLKLAVDTKLKFCLVFAEFGEFKEEFVHWFVDLVTIG